LFQNSKSGNTRENKHRKEIKNRHKPALNTEKFIVLAKLAIACKNKVLENLLLLNLKKKETCLHIIGARDPSSGYCG